MHSSYSWKRVQLTCCEWFWGLVDYLLQTAWRGLSCWDIFSVIISKCEWQWLKNNLTTDFLYCFSYCLILCSIFVLASDTVGAVRIVLSLEGSFLLPKLSLYFSAHRDHHFILMCYYRALLYFSWKRWTHLNFTGLHMHDHACMVVSHIFYSLIIVACNF